MAYDRTAGPDLRQIVILPRSSASRQHLAVLQRVSQGNPNFPAILEYHPRRDEIVVLTTWIWGDDLQEYLDEATHGNASWPSPIETCKLYRGLAHGLNHLHRRCNVVHGDIKPANLILASGPNRLVMIDYGSAWTVEKTVQRAPADGVTQRYAAPEQLMKEPAVDFRSDQFSASVVAFQMLTGQLPYSRMGGLAGLTEHRSVYEPRFQPPSRLSRDKARVPRRIWRRIDEVVSTGLALDPRKRFQSGSQWLDALDDLHCATRRRVEFQVWDSVMFRLFDWIGTLATRRRKR